MSVTDNDTGNGIMAVQASSQPSNGEISMTGMKTFSYKPKSGFVGSDSFTYQAKDAAQAESNTATVSIDVTPKGEGERVRQLR